MTHLRRESQVVVSPPVLFEQETEAAVTSAFYEFDRKDELARRGVQLSEVICFESTPTCEETEIPEPKRTPPKGFEYAAGLPDFFEMEEMRWKRLNLS